jgi:hypothetical protein
MTTNDSAEALAKAIETTTQWREHCQKIETDLAQAKADAISHGEKRKTHSLNAALGTASATKAIADARAAQREAEQLAEDLEVALVEARGLLREAEVRQGVCQRAVNVEKVREIIGRRVQASEAFDRAGEAMEAALKDFDRCYHELSAYPEAFGDGTNTSVMELKAGNGRIRQSVPASLRKVFGIDGSGGKLATSEVNVWRSFA